MCCVSSHHFLVTKISRTHTQAQINKTYKSKINNKSKSKCLQEFHFILKNQTWEVVILYVQLQFFLWMLIFDHKNKTVWHERNTTWGLNRGAAFELQFKASHPHSLPCWNIKSNSTKKHIYLMVQNTVLPLWLYLLFYNSSTWKTKSGA